MTKTETIRAQYRALRAEALALVPDATVAGFDAWARQLANENADGEERSARDWLQGAVEIVSLVRSSDRAVADLLEESAYAARRRAS